MKAGRLPSEDATSSALVDRRLGIDGSVSPTGTYAGF